MTVAELVDGPLWTVALTVFVAGVAWRLLVLIATGWKRDLSHPRSGSLGGAIRGVVGRFLPSQGMAGRLRLHLVAGYLFHLGLFALLFFAAPHVDFYRDRLFGFDWTPLPHWAFILAAEAAFLGLLLLWLNRVLNPVTRLISESGDHAASVLTFLVMLTGCLALARSHETLRLLHFFVVELFMIYFPFSRLMHSFTFLLSRAAQGAHYGRRGVRV